MNFTSHRSVVVSAIPFALMFAGGCASCSGGGNVCITGDEDECELDASVPPDNCDSTDEAVSNPDCHLVVGDGCPAAKNGAAAEVKTGRITTLTDGGRDIDIYSAVMPEGLNARCLLHVVAGYSVPQTAVNMAVNVTEQGTPASVMSGVDKHGAAAPKLVDLIVPYDRSGTTLLVQVNDEGATVQTKVDNRNDYTVKVELIENPDLNEPNDTTPTAITLGAGTDGSNGTQSGYLATADDVDQYSFEVTGTRQIIYLHIGSTMTNLSPPTPFKVSYSLLDPAGTQISEGVMDNEFLQVDLKTARLAAMPGTYKVIVKGFKPDGQTAKVPGDLRLKYDVEVRVMPDLDTQEPNDAIETAQTLNLTPGTTTLIGRLAYVGDEEWFKVVVPSSASARTITFEVKVSDVGGRFPALSAVPTRQARLLSQVTTGVTAQDRQNACKNDSAVCPRSFTDPNGKEGQLVTSLCGVADPPQCAWSERNEEAQISGLKDLRNFVGSMPVPAAGKTFYFMFRDQGARAVKYADDKEWTIRLTLTDDPDEQGRTSGVPQVVPLTPPPGVTATGVITYGYGFLRNFDPNRGNGVRGPNDYDAYESDRDLYQFNFPGGSTGDQTWGLQWTLYHPDAGAPAGDLSMEMTLCGSATLDDAGFCGAQQRFILNPTYEAITPWYLPIVDGNRRILFTKTTTPGQTVITATEDACYCFQGNKVPAGRFYVNVTAIDRVNNDPMRYSLTQSVTPYPGGATQCPVSDGGCKFPNSL